VPSFGTFYWGTGYWGTPDPTAQGAVDEDDLTTPTPPLISVSSTETGDYYPLGCIYDVAGEGEDRLLEQFEDSVLLKALLATYLAQVQELEDHLCLMLRTRDKNAATDQWLTDIGELVGESRDGLADALYRTFVCARIIANNSHGTPPELLTCIREAVEVGTHFVAFNELQPMTLQMIVSGPGMGATWPGEKMFRILDDARIAGIHFSFQYNPTADADTFTFAPPGDAVVISNRKGFANDGQTTGGHMTAVFGPTGG